MNIINFLKSKICSTVKQEEIGSERYFDIITSKNNDANQYSFEKRYQYQENTLLSLYGNSDKFDKKIRLIVVSDTHNCLNEIEFKEFTQINSNYDACILLGDHDTNDIELILKYIDRNKIYGLLGNHDYNYLEKYNITNLNGKVVNINGVNILGIEGSFKYKPVRFPSFTQIESILFLNDKPKVDILFSHDNSFDNKMENNPSHQGLFGITYYLFKNKVPYHIHGHIHEKYVNHLINGTKEISSYMYEYIELDKDQNTDSN